MKGEKETSWGVTFEPKVQQTMNGFPRRTKYCCNTNNICANNAAFPGIEYPDPSAQYAVHPTDVEQYYLQLQMRMYLYLQYRCFIRICVTRRDMCKRLGIIFSFLYSFF